MRSPVQKTFLLSLASILRPIIALALKFGLSSKEFKEVVSAVFITVASEDYGVRGRPANISRISVLTGISRKEIRKTIDNSTIPRWSPEMEASPASAVLHHWHYDSEYCYSPGCPRPLPPDGNGSFAEMVRRYAGDVPIGAMRTALERANVVVVDDAGLLSATNRFLHPSEFDEDFVRTIGYSIQNVASTVAYNASLVHSGVLSPDMNDRLGRFERFAWSSNLDADTAEIFRHWVRRAGTEFLVHADNWMGERQIPKSEWEANDSPTVGVGVYFFQE
jgi:hypothetical protein